MTDRPPNDPAWRTPPVHVWLRPIRQFMRIEAASGVVLLLCTLGALALANSPFGHAFDEIWHTPIAVSIGAFAVRGTFGHLVVNDGLMTVFFFVIGLEIKRELVTGELRDPRKALLPVVAAVGGMIGPALVYATLQWGQPGARGWAVPMATDIAFVVGLLALLGRRAPFGLKIFLLTLAIVDDIGAVLVIALVFSGKLAWGWLATAAAGLVVAHVLNRIGVRAVLAYAVVGVVVWFAFLESGVHPTVAGVILGLMTPTLAWVDVDGFGRTLQVADRHLQEGDWNPEHPPAVLRRLRFAARELESPLHRLETALHPWVAFGIMPLFALANAGVVLESAALREPVALAVAAGLVLGKPMGIVAFSWLAIRAGVCQLPGSVTWTMMLAGGFLGGIGFTMALFLNALAFPSADFAALQSAGKLGVLLGSAVAAAVGAGILLAMKNPRQD